MKENGLGGKISYVNGLGKKGLAEKKSFINGGGKPAACKKKRGKKKWMVAIVAVIMITNVLVLLVYNQANNNIRNASSIIRVIVPKGKLGELGSNAKILVNYGAFALVEIPRNLVKLRADPSISTVDYTIHFNAGDFAAGINGKAASDSIGNIPSEWKINGYGAKGDYLIQMIGPVKKEWVDELKSMNVKIEQPMYPYSYIVSMDSSLVNIIKGLKDSNGVNFVNYVGVYQPYWKVSTDILKGYTYQWAVNPMIAYQIKQLNPNFKNQLIKVWWDVSKAPKGAITTTEPLKVIIKTFGNVNDFSRILTRIDNAKVLSMNSEYHKMVVEVYPSDLYNMASELAKMPEVYYVEIQPQFYVMNVDSHWVGQSDVAMFYPAYYWDVLPLWRHGLWGQGQVVGLTDSGIDIDNIFFRDTNPDGTLKYPGAGHRKIVSYRVNSNSAAYDDDIIGHGSHTAGTIAGDRGTIGYPDPFDGMAPLAKISFDDSGDPSNPDAVNPDVPGDYAQQYYDPNGSARIHSNSWGSSSDSYDSMAADTDNFMWNHRDDLILFAAGNAGPGASTLGTPGTAKDIITVGAAVNWVDEQVADFSSHGPVDDGRLKPTICAPGVWIESADSDQDIDTNNSGFMKMDGTSMATPTMAGYAALVRQYYVDGFYPDGAKNSSNSFIPSGDLIKATMVNSAWDMAWEFTGDAGTPPKHIPSNGQGWGKLNLDNALYFKGDSRRLLILRNGLNHTDDFTSSGQSHIYHIHVGNSQDLKITLAWTDYKGPTNSNPDIINNLDLNVTAPDGTLYKGNAFSNGYSTTGGSNDNLNTVEQVLIPASLVQEGDWTINVTAANIQQSSQPYALVATGDLYDISHVTANDRDSSSENIQTLPHFQMNDITNIPPVDSELNIRLGDWNANTAPSSIDSMSVTVQINGKDSETVTLQETGANTGIFTGSIPLNASTTGNSGNGKLEVADGDIVEINYGSKAYFNVTVDATAPTLERIILPYDDGQYVNDDPKGVEGNWTASTRLGTHYAVIDFTTNEGTKAMVKYGELPDKLLFTTSWDAYTKNHSIGLFDLDSSTYYYFKIIVMDRAGNINVFDNNGSLYSFKTLDGAYIRVPGYSGYVLYDGSKYYAQYINKPIGYTGRFGVKQLLTTTYYTMRSHYMFDFSKYANEINKAVKAELRLYNWGGWNPTRSGDSAPWPWYIGVMTDNDESYFSPGNNPSNAQAIYDDTPSNYINYDDYMINQGNHFATVWNLNSDAAVFNDFKSSVSNNDLVLFKFWTKDDSNPSRSNVPAGLTTTYYPNVRGPNSGHNNLVFQGEKLFSFYAPEIRLWFRNSNTGHVEFDRNVYSGTDWAHITVWDSGANVNPNNIDTVTVTVKDLNTQDIENLTLQEVDKNASVFWGVIKLTYSNGHPDTSGGQSENINLSGDMTLDVQDGDTIQVKYVDNNPAITSTDNATIGITDHTPPTISNVGVTVQSDTSLTREEADAVIQWDTNENATSIVKWGSADGNYGGIQLGYGEWTTHHLVTLEDLPRTVKMYYTIYTFDESGNVATSTGSFTTPTYKGASGSSYNVHTGPIIYNVSLNNTIIEKSGASYNPSSITLNATADDGVFNDGNGTDSNGYKSWVYVHNARGLVDGRFPITVSAKDGAFNQRIENLTATIDVTNLPVGVHYITIQAQGPNYTWGPVKTVYFFVKDASDGHIIYGYVKYADGTVASNAQVNITINGQNISVQTDSDGFYRADISSLSYNDGDIIYVNATYTHKPYTDFGTNSIRADNSMPWQRVDVILQKDALVPEINTLMLIPLFAVAVAVISKARENDNKKEK